MCGLVGFFTRDSSKFTKETLEMMANTISSRGPDSFGYFLDQHQGIGLGHRRLAIVDLSPAGHQPMLSIKGRYHIVFNGEIYNHFSLRHELELIDDSLKWNGHSDTETLAAGFDIWGVEVTLKKCVGMFALAIWDNQEKNLILSRDRLGEKPLYYGWQGNSFLFASELKALKSHPDFNAEIDRNALALYLRHNYIPAPYSIYENIYKLEPGSLLNVNLAKPEPALINYWSSKSVIEQASTDSFSGTFEQAVDKLEYLMLQSIGQQMIADVPLGAFLSGGIDSSAIAALMQAQSATPIKTFTIGFHEEGYNEAIHAKAVAKHLGTEHTELYVSAQQAQEVIPQLAELYCEPFADSSQIPTYLVSQLARQHVTVSLSGDAGDELFGGYWRYLWTQSVSDKINKTPLFLRNAISHSIKILSPETWNKLSAPVKQFLPAKWAQANIGDKLHKAADVINVNSSAELYYLMSSYWKNPESIVINSSEYSTIFTDSMLLPKTNSFFEQMMALDMLSYLPDDILCKVDRAGMGVSLETRVPLLDHRIVEFAWQLPLNMKVRNGVVKAPLREILYRYVPKKLIERPKMGFGIPLDDWLRGELRSWAESLLDEHRLQKEGYFYSQPIRQKWAEHLSGNYNWGAYLWSILMFQSWLEHNH